MTVQIAEIQKQFNQVIAYSQGFSDPKTDELFAQWYKAKKWFIDKFDGKLIYEVPEIISFPLNAETQTSRWSHLINRLCDGLGAYGIADFVERQGVTALFENKVQYEEKTIDGEKIPVGMKLIKAFKYFHFEPEIVNLAQTLASMTIQESKIEGKLCFSVHPLDFLSASENNYNWRSCHALDGEYRCGNLSYMTDKITVMCYLKGDHEDEVLPRFGEVKWNSKKWRMFLYFNDDTYDAWFAGKQYPFACSGALDTVREIFVRNILGDSLNHWSYWHDDVITKFSYQEHDYADGTIVAPIRCFGGSLYQMKELVEDGEYAQQFNDLLRSSTYQPYYGWRKYYQCCPPGKIHFTVGAAAPCIACGQLPIITGDSMFCKECELEYGSSEDDEQFVYCDHCGCRMYVDEANYLSTGWGEYYCDQCWESQTARCADCGCRYNIRDLYTEEGSDEWYCEDCLTERKEKE